MILRFRSSIVNLSIIPQPCTVRLGEPDAGALPSSLEKSDAHSRRLPAALRPPPTFNVETRRGVPGRRCGRKPDDGHTGF